MHIKNYITNPLDISYEEISSNYAQQWALPYITLWCSFVLSWYSILRTPSCVLDAWEMIISLWVSTVKNCTDIIFSFVMSDMYNDGAVNWEDNIFACFQDNLVGSGRCARLGYAIIDKAVGSLQQFTYRYNHNFSTPSSTLTSRLSIQDLSGNLMWMTVITLVHPYSPLSKCPLSLWRRVR